MKRIKTIVLTGGPHAGKSEILKLLREHFKGGECRCIFVNEVATEVVDTGLERLRWRKNFDFEYAIAKMQIFKEDMYKEAAARQPEETVAIILDRGLLDIKGYTSGPEWAGICREFTFKEEDLYKRYDCVIHLDTSTKGYADGSNEARFENEQEAVEANELIWKIYEGHSNRHRVCATDDFRKKADAVVRIIEEELYGGNLE